jgi:hypothetical protein
MIHHSSAEHITLLQWPPKELRCKAVDYLIRQTNVCNDHVCIVPNLHEAQHRSHNHCHVTLRTAIEAKVNLGSRQVKGGRSAAILLATSIANSTAIAVNFSLPGTLIQ